MVHVSDVGLDERSEGAMEGQSEWPPEDVFPEEARSSRVDLADLVVHLQKEVEEFQVESGFSGSCSSAIPPRAGRDIRQRRCPCLQARLVGTSIGRCLRRLLVPMGGMV